MVVGSSSIAVTETSDFASVSSKEFIDIQAIIECGFILKCVRDMIRTYSLPFLSFTKQLNFCGTGLITMAFQGKLLSHCFPKSYSLVMKLSKMLFQFLTL